MTTSMLTCTLLKSIAQQSGTLGFLGAPGPQEMMIVGIIALLLFGKRLPEVARNLGKGFSEFKKGMSGFQDEIRTASREVDRKVNYADSSRSTAQNRPAPPAEVVQDDEFAAPKFDLD